MHFLALPREIRDLVYEHLFQEQQVRWEVSSVKEKERGCAIALTCRQVFHESMPVFHRMAIFLLPVEVEVDHRESFVAKHLVGKHRLKITWILYLGYLGYSFQTGQWKRVDGLESIKYITFEERSGGYCPAEYHPSCSVTRHGRYLSHGEIFTELILTARAIGIALSMKLSAYEAIHEYPGSWTTAIVEISPTFDVYIMLRDEPEFVHRLIDDLQGQNKESVDRLIQPFWREHLGWYFDSDFESE